MSTYSFMKVFTAGLLKGMRIVERMQFSGWDSFSAWAEAVNANHKRGANDYYVVDACGWPIP